MKTNLSDYFTGGCKNNGMVLELYIMKLFVLLFLADVIMATTACISLCLSKMVGVISYII